MAYKVVFRIGSRLESLTRLSFPSYAVTYIPGEIVRPKLSGSKLFCFTKLEYARTHGFIQQHEIWTCEVTEAAEIPLRLVVTGSTDQTDLMNFWAEDRDGANSGTIWVWTTKGTIGVDTVKLIKRVW